MIDITEGAGLRTKLNGHQLGRAFVRLPNGGPLDKTFKFYTGNMVGIVMGNDVLEVFSDFSGMRIPPNDLGDYQLYFIPGDYSTGRPQWIVRHLGYHDEEPDLVWEFDGRKTWVLQGDYEDEEY